MENDCVNRKIVSKPTISFVLGLTGGIASGKSVVAEMLKKHGARIIDADILAKIAIKTGSDGERQILEAFKTADRKELRKIAFKSKANSDKLDSITHPIIIRLIKEELKKQKEDTTDSVIVLVAPLLFECNLHLICDQTWQLSATADIRIKRATERDNVSIKDAEAIMRRQMPDHRREDLADKVIHNNGTLEELDSLISVLFPPFAAV